MFFSRCIILLTLCERWKNVRVGPLHLNRVVTVHYKCNILIAFNVHGLSIDLVLRNPCACCLPIEPINCFYGDVGILLV
jgi:hypothetical protein